MELVNLELHIPDDEPKVRVYENYVVFNAAAKTLLGIGNGDYVQFWVSRFGQINGKPWLYVGKTKNIFGYSVRRRLNTMRVNSRSLARMLRQQLDGAGCYHICPDDTELVDGEVRYNIFFKNYDKKDSD